MKKIKFIKRQDSGFKLSYGNSGETSLNLSNEIFDFISKGVLTPGEEKEVTFRIYKEDCIKAMSFVIMKLPLYKSSSNYCNKVDNYLEIFGELYSKIDSFFGVNKDAEYKVSLFYRPDGRIYIKGLRVNGFSIRDYLVENYSALQFDDEGDDLLNLRVLSDITENKEFEDEDTLGSESSIRLLQQIFYGAPGTGKSHKIKDNTSVKSAEEKNLVFRTTFHPDSDYSTFVGAYKPVMKPVADKYKAVAGKDEEIAYTFVPQAFLQAYIAAWNNPEENTYLIVEEINRGNCAQIFGDLFQLLDRDDEGYSEYPIKADRDLEQYLKSKDEDENDILTNKDGIKDGKLKLPKNLYIWATMNTSDQSLFPIDSAFKRRWDWKYVPISNSGEQWYIETASKRYDWWQFLEKINGVIGTTTNSEDKKLGYFFCKAKNKKIDAETFVGKVVFYLWNDVFKDFIEEADTIFKDDKGETLSFNRFYSVEGHDVKVVDATVDQFLTNLGVEAKELDDASETTKAESEITLNGEFTDEIAKKQRKETLISIQLPGYPKINSSDSTQFDAFVKTLKIIGIDKVLSILTSLKYQRLNCPVLSSKMHDGILNNNQGYSYHQEGSLYILKGCKNYTYIRILEDLGKLLNIGLTLETK